jgi:hypothetical protein
MCSGSTFFTRSLRDVQEMNAYRAGHTCLFVRMIQLGNTNMADEV